MRFQPKTEEQIAEDGLLAIDRSYDFTVESAEDAVSKSSGNEMIKLKLAVYRDDGSTKVIFDYLLEKMAYKLRHFCEAVGILDKYEDGSLTAGDCDKRSGKVILDIDDGGNGYPPKNVVKDYLVERIMRSADRPQEFTSIPGVAPVPIQDDDIPF